jgi:hypothetical protein
MKFFKMLYCLKKYPHFAIRSQLIPQCPTPAGLQSVKLLKETIVEQKIKTLP